MDWVGVIMGVPDADAGGGSSLGGVYSISGNPQCGTSTMPAGR